MRYTLARGLSEVVEKPDVMLVGNGRRLVYRRGSATPARVVNQKEIKFTEVGLWLRKVLLAITSAESAQSYGEFVMMTCSSFKKILECCGLSTNSKMRNKNTQFLHHILTKFDLCYNVKIKSCMSRIKNNEMNLMFLYTHQ